MKYYFTLISLLIISTLTYSKTNTIISGTVADKNDAPVYWASVALLNPADSSVKDGTVTDTTGYFEFINIEPGAYLIKISGVGYKNYFAELNTAIETTTDLGKIILIEDAQLLEEVKILALKPTISNNGDKLIMNIENSVLSTGGNALDVIKRTPGVTVNNDDQIVIKGKQGVNVMVNDKQIYLAGDQLENYLKNLPADQIAQIELITNPSAKYDAQGNAGIINIVLKKNKLEGLNGSLQGSAGKGELWTSEAGGSLNYMHKGLRISTGYNYRNQGYKEIVDINRNIAFDGSITQIAEHSEISNRGPNNNANLSIDYDVNEKNTIGISANGFINHDDGDANTIAGLTDEYDAFLLGTNTTSITDGDYRNYALNGYYHVKLDSLGSDLTANIDYAYFDGKSLSNFDTYYLNEDGSNSGTALFIENDNPTSVAIQSAKIDYTRPFKNNSNFEAGIKSSYVVTDNEIISSYDAGDGWILDTTQTNHFEYSEMINAGYVNFSHQYKKIQLSGGLRVEQTISKGNSLTLNNIVDRNYVDFFPSFSVNDMFNENHMLGFTYSKRINRPSYEDLNPFIYYLDPYVFVRGNPFLQPEITHSFELTYTFKQQFMLSASYSNTSDFIMQLLYQNDTTNTTYQTTDNFDHFNVYALTLYTPFDIAKWCNLTPMITAYKLLQNTIYEGAEFNTDIFSFNANLSATFRLPENFTFELSGHYENAGYWGIVKYESMWNTDVAIKKTLWNEKAIISFSASDIFGTNNFEGTFEVNNIDAYVLNDSDNTQLRLGFQYHFGQATSQNRSHRSGNEDEMNRVKMGN